MRIVVKLCGALLALLVMAILGALALLAVSVADAEGVGTWSEERSW